MFNNVQQSLASLFAVATIAAGSVVLTGSPALAVSCKGPYPGSWQTVRSSQFSPNGNRAVNLVLVNEQAFDYSGVEVWGDLRYYDDIWVERLNGANWEACPRTQVGLDGATVSQGRYVALNRNNSSGTSFTMRACFEYTLTSGPRNRVCTDPYTDHE